MPVRRLFILCLTFVLVACQRQPIYLETPTTSGFPAITTQRNATLQQLSGLVEVQTAPNAAWQTAQPGLVLAQGMGVRTGPGARGLLLLTEGTKIWVGPDTTLTISLLNPFLDSQLTALNMETGQVWGLLNGGALDVETPLGTATARGAYLSVNYEARTRLLTMMCLQGLCGFGSVLIPTGYKLVDAARNTAPEPMGFADYGAWGVNVPEATQLAYLATEAVAQGNATLPVVSTATPQLGATNTAWVTLTPLPQPSGPAPTLPSYPTPTAVVFYPTVTPRPYTPIPPAPIIGQHLVQPGETIFCIARGYGILPAAIAQANGLAVPFNVYAGQNLAMPAVQWVNISPGPVCQTQFVSPYPGLPVPTLTPMGTATLPPQALMVSLDLQCIDNCGQNLGTYMLRVTLAASGGQPPYTFVPAQSFDVTLDHCVDGTGSITVSSADGQTVTLPWYYRDVACLPTAAPSPTLPPSATAPPSPTVSPTDTPLPTNTTVPTDTPIPTATPVPPTVTLTP